MKVACIQLSSTDNYKRNIDTILKYIKLAIKKNADLIITPETSSIISDNKKKLYQFSFTMGKDPLVKKLKPISYRSYYRGQQLVLKLHEPFEQEPGPLTFQDLKQNKYEMSATLTFVKHDKTFSLKGSWGSRGFILLKGFDPDKNESFYLDTNPNI